MTAPTEHGLIARGQTVWSKILRTRPYRAFSHFTDVGGAVLSGGMSYQALFAVFAGLVVGFGIFGLTLRSHPELLDTVVRQLNVFVPGLVGDNGAVPVNALLATRALDWTSLVASLSLVWIAMNWFTGTRRSIRIIFGLEVKQYRNFALLKLRDFILALGFFLALIVSALLTVMSSSITDALFAWLGVDSSSWFFGGLGTLLRYGAMYLFDFIMLLAMHRYLAEVRVPRWNLIVGCALGAAVLFVIKLLGTALLGGATSNPLLVPFAVFIGLLLWFNFICRALLLTSSWIATGLNPELGLPDAAGPDSPIRFAE